jgi:uncharacterized membrane protein required for colicin V production
MSIIFDVLTVIIIIAIIWSSAKKGLVRSVIELAGYIASLIVAAVLSIPVGNWIYLHLLKTFFDNQAAGYISSLTGGAREAFGQFLTQYNLSSDLLSGAAKSSGDALNGAVMSGVGAIGQIVGRGIAFVIIFLVCMILVRIIARLANIINRLPVIRGVNKFGGALIGVVKAALVMFVLCTIIAFMIPLFAVQKNPPFTNTTINNTYLFKYIYQVNPVKGILLKN